VDACTVAALDVITAFAVPNPNCSFAESVGFFGSGGLLSYLSTTNHPAYFGLANFIKPTLSAIDASKSTDGASHLSMLFLAGTHFSVGVFVENKIEYCKTGYTKVSARNRAIWLFVYFHELAVLSPENASGDGYPKFTNRKSPLGSPSLCSMVAISHVSYYLQNKRYNAAWFGLRIETRRKWRCNATDH
jgi:hypothetical protein